MSSLLCATLLVVETESHAPWKRYLFKFSGYETHTQKSFSTLPTVFYFMKNKMWRHRILRHTRKWWEWELWSYRWCWRITSSIFRMGVCYTSRSHAYLFCGLSHGFWRKRDCSQRLLYCATCVLWPSPPLLILHITSRFVCCITRWCTCI